MRNFILANKVLFYAFSAFVFCVLFYFIFLSAPGNFPVNSVFRVEKGSSLRSTSLQLKSQNFIRSHVLFETFVVIFGGEKNVISTDYYFEDKLPVFEIARRISKGEHNMAPISVTIPEGFDLEQIAETFALKLKNFNQDQFLSQAKKMEGYLFPDTYFFLTDDTEKEVINSLGDNFNKRIAPLLPAIDRSGKSKEDIIIMASIIEREAKGDVDRGIISGILWKRIKISMPLQVDAAPDTYKTKGLPVVPIANPGLPAIIASINPQSSPYLYYLHDKNGNIHYAKNFAEHSKNIVKYLK